MSFLDTKVDLAGTIFSQRELEMAREYLVELLEWEDPAWLRKPVGYLSRLWLSDDLYSVCYLIDFARLFNRLERVGVTCFSKLVLFKKLHQLLRKTPQRSAFEETLTELQLAAYLADKVGPVLLEPRILDTSAGRKPSLAPLKGEKVIDLAVSLAHQVLFVEVTVLNFEALNEWIREARHLVFFIQNSLALENLTRTVQLELPFPAPPELLSEPVIQELLEKVTSQFEGEMALRLNSANSLRLQWQTSGQEEESDRVADLAGPSGEIGFTQGRVSCRVAGEDLSKFDEWLFKSLRNSLKIKKAQCQPEISPLLVIRPGSALLTAERLGSLIEKRLWPNSRYSWLSGIAIFTASSGFGKNEPGPTLQIKANPKAHFPFGETARESLNKLQSGPKPLPD